MQDVETDALVVAFKNYGNSMAPIVEYNTGQGLLKVKSKYSGSRFFFPFKVGDTIRIKYNNENSKQFLIVGNCLTTVMWSILILMGGIDIIGGITLHFLVVS
jgi:hypothetical protein